jgi:signal transduction histidine kinase
MRSDVIEEFDASTDPVELIRKLRSSLGRIFHDTNNPLAIVSGNAQFLLEVGRSMELESDLIQPMQDIEEASERVAEGLKEISMLRDRIGDYLKQRAESGTS